MKNVIFILFFLTFSLAINSQENKLFAELDKIKSANDKVSYVLNIKVNQLENINLSNKLNSELNTINSCLNSFSNSKELKLNKKEISELKDRVEKIAINFFKLNYYVQLESSGGIAPIYGIGIDTIAKRKVVIVHLGGDCTIDEIDLKLNEIISVFNQKMGSLLKK